MKKLLNENYVKQCDCPEIQDGHKWEIGDIFFAECTTWVIGEACFRYEESRDGVFHRLPEPVAVILFPEEMDGENISCPKIWLPHEEQLQEMVFEHAQSKPGVCHTPLMKLFAEFLAWVPYHGTDFPTFKQLWLAFVMKELYNKVWINEKWVNE